MEDEKSETESFLAKVRKGNAEKQKELTIDAKVSEFLGLEAGDTLKVWIKKIADKEEE